MLCKHSTMTNFPYTETSLETNLKYLLWSKYEYEDILFIFSDTKCILTCLISYLRHLFASFLKGNIILGKMEHCRSAN